MSEVVTWTTAATLVLGFGSGVLAGMFGIGGAVITTPSIRVLGATPIQAVGSTVPAILPGSISGAYRYWREGLVDWRVGLVCGGTGALFAAGGAKLDDLVDAHYLMILTAALLAFSGVSIIRSADAPVPEPLPAAGPEGDQAEAIVEPVTRDDLLGPSRVAASAGVGTGTPARGVASVGVLALVGAAAGLLAGLLGVGGGIVMMPAFTGLLRMPIKLAVGSSLVAVAMFSIPALIMHTALGHIAWRFALPLMIGVVPGAQVGAHISVGSSDRTMRVLFGSFILVLSVVYGTSEILALR
ncbi:MAG: sulfite exporter TauE/SafE family protein [Acidimicrobiales bacterium]